MQPDQPGLDEISAEDIAELAGVTSSAVSNWSRRETDFPDPTRLVGRRKLYDRSEVLAWLERNRPDTHDSDLAPDRQLWQLADTARGTVSFTDMVQSVAWLTALVRESVSLPEDPHELAERARVVADLDETPLDRIAGSTVGPDLIAQMTSLARRIARDGGLALDRFVESAATNSPASHGEATEALLDDLVDAACVAETHNVLDPAAGFGQLLRRVHDRTGASRLEGRYDSDTNLALATAINAARNTRATALLAEAAESVPPASRFDRVISVAPYLLGKSSFTERSQATVDPDPRWVFVTPRSDDSWEAALQRALWETRLDGAVVFAVTNAALAGLASQEARRAAALNGAITAVVGTQHLMPGTNVPLSFMIAARHAEEASGDRRVLMVDLANAAGSELPRDWHLWIRGVAGSSDPRCASVTLDELSKHDFNLDPARYVKPPQEEVDAGGLAQRLVENAGYVDERLEALDGALAMVSIPEFEPQRSDWRTVTLGELVDAKVIHIAVGRGKRTTSDRGQHPLLTARHLEHVCDLAAETCDAEEAASTEIVRSGDLIIRLDHGPHTTRVVTDHQDGWALGSGLARIRPDRSGTASELGWIAAWTTGVQFRADCDRLSGGSTIRRLSTRDLRRVEIPLPPHPVQRAAAAYQRIVTELEVASCAARRAIDDLIETSTQLLNAHLMSPTSPERNPAPPASNKQAVRKRPRSEVAERLFGVRFNLQHKQLEASGRPAGDKFLVFAGAQARMTAADSLPPAYQRLREDLMNQGVLAAEHETLRLITDYTFASPTAAASVLTGTSTNGLRAWVKDDGQTLKQYLEHSGIGQ